MAMIIQIAMAMINNGDNDNNHGSDNDDNNDDGVIEAIYAIHPIAKTLQNDKQ